jgi:major vault protein
MSLNAVNNNIIYRIPPYHYIHVLDQNKNVSRLEVGPKTFVRQDNEKVILGPEKMITVPPQSYCIIENPVLKDPAATNAVLFDSHGQAKLSFGDTEIRFSNEPFPLYPGETLKQEVTALKIIGADCALRLRAILDFNDGGDDATRRVTAGDEWLFEGPGTYMPRKEVKVEEQIKSTVVKMNQAVRLRASKECVDRAGASRVTGEEWLVKRVGAYLPLAYEQVVRVEEAHVLTKRTALHMQATATFVNDFGNKRLNGDEWLVTAEHTDAHICNVYEELVGVVDVTCLSARQYAVVLDPCDTKTGKCQLGEDSFF